MKNRSYFSWVGLFVLLVASLFVASCPEPSLNPDQQVRPKITGDGPVLVFTEKIIEFLCGEVITKETILEKLKDEVYLKVVSGNEEHSGDFVFEVADFTIPAHTHGFFDISFSVADSTGKKTDCTFAIKINENKTPGTVTLTYDGTTALKFPVGTDPALNITALLRKEGSGLTVTNTNSCADAKGYTMVEGVFPPDGTGGVKYYASTGTYAGVRFKVQDYLGVKSEEVSVTIEIIATDDPPMITPPTTALVVAYQATVTDEDLYSHLKTGEILSPDVSVNWENSRYTRITVVDTSKTGVQRIYGRVTDKHGHQSEKFFIRLEISSVVSVSNMLQDPGFEAEPAPVVGTWKKDSYRTARLSSHWKIVPTKVSIRGNNTEGGSVPNRDLRTESVACTNNDADYAQGPFILNTQRFITEESNTSLNVDDGYGLVKTFANMAELGAIPTLDHMLIYRATEKKNTGSYSFALRGKKYRPLRSYHQFWNFWGVGCALQQEVTLEPGHKYKAKASIITSFGHNETNHLDGMVGSIYIRVRKQTGGEKLVEKHIKGHPNASLYGKFIPFETAEFSVTETTNAIFEIRRYLSNDDDNEDETRSTWGYSPIYIDDCELVDTPVPATHIPEEEQLPPTEG